MSAQRTAPAGKGEGRGDRVGAGSGASLRRRLPLRPDLLATYPDPANYCALPTTFGLSWPEFVAEVRRRKAEGWAAWEIDARLSREAVSL